VLTLYVDGVPVASTTTTITGPISPNAPFVLGQVSPTYNGEFFNGLADEADLFSRALSPAEVQWIYNAGSAGKHQTISGSASVKVGTATATSSALSLTTSVSASTPSDPVAPTSADPSGTVPAGPGHLSAVPWQGTGPVGPEGLASSGGLAAILADNVFTLVGGDAAFGAAPLTLAAVAAGPLSAPATTAAASVPGGTGQVVPAPARGDGGPSLVLARRAAHGPAAGWADDVLAQPGPSGDGEAASWPAG
jgi:hypothetical protein